MQRFAAFWVVNIAILGLNVFLFTRNDNQYELKHYYDHLRQMASDLETYQRLQKQKDSEKDIEIRPTVPDAGTLPMHLNPSERNKHCNCPALPPVTTPKPPSSMKNYHSWSLTLHTTSVQDTIDTSGGVLPKPVRKRDYKVLREGYRVPALKRTKKVNCDKILAGDEEEIKKGLDIMEESPKVPIYEERYQTWLRDCERFKRKRGFIKVPLTQEEEDYPLAFSIAMYKDIEQVERLLRMIYQPQNIYCIHIDIKSSVHIHRTMRDMVGCFDNVFIASNLDKIKWGDVSVLLPAINCMRDLAKYYKGKFKYYINLTGQEIPLRTNLEFVRIAKVFNGSNDIAGSIKKMEADKDRVTHLWTHRWSKTYQQTIFFDTMHPKAPPRFNLTFYKGELHGLFSQRMVEYLAESEIALEYLKWCWDSGHPSEHYWNTLNYNPHLRAPGGYEGPIKDADEYAGNQAIRAKHWQDMTYGNRTCGGNVVRGICVYGLRDLPWLAKRKELAANKFHLTFQHLAYDCLEERHRNRTRKIGQLPEDFDIKYYENLPTVKYGRKDGLYENLQPYSGQLADMKKIP